MRASAMVVALIALECSYSSHDHLEMEASIMDICHPELMYGSECKKDERMRLYAQCELRTICKGFLWCLVHYLGNQHSRTCHQRLLT